MMDKNKLFHKMANEILANSSKGIITSDSPKSLLGDKLYQDFVRKLLKKFTELKGIEGKLVTSFRRGSRNILSIEKQSAFIKITFNAKKGTLRDSKELLRDVSKIGHWGNGDYQIKLNDQVNFDYVLDLVKQIY
jgi:predicted transport protein